MPGNALGAPALSRASAVTSPLPATPEGPRQHDRPCPRDRPTAVRGSLQTVLLFEAAGPQARRLRGPRPHHSLVDIRLSECELCSLTASGCSVHSSLRNIPAFLLYSCFTGPNSVSQCSWGTRRILHCLAFVHVLPQILFSSLLPMVVEHRWKNE